jgi:hypothetical protein
MRERWYLITPERGERRCPQTTAFAQGFNGRRAADRNYFLVPVAALSMLDELPAFILPVAAPVVVPFFMFVCLVVLLVAP